jgi:hypothetical protein
MRCVFIEVYYYRVYTDVKVVFGFRLSPVDFTDLRLRASGYGVALFRRALPRADA